MLSKQIQRYMLDEIRDSLKHPEWSYGSNRLKWCRRNATVKAKFEHIESVGLVRLVWDYDECVHYDDLAGDCFNESNADHIPGGLRALKAQEKEFKSKIEQDGVWVLRGEYRLSDSDEWEHADSCGGFVGQDDNGYEPDIMEETMRQLITALKSREIVSRSPRFPRASIGVLANA